VEVEEVVKMLLQPHQEEQVELVEEEMEIRLLMEAVVMVQ